MEWLLLYLALLTLALLWSLIISRWIHKRETVKKIWEGGVAVLGVAAAGAAGAFVAIGLEVDSWVPWASWALILLAASFGAATTAFSSFAISDYVKKATGAKRKMKHLDSEGLRNTPTPSWLKANEQALLKKIAKLTNQSKLLEAVVHSSAERVRNAALDKITDEKLLLAAVHVTARGTHKRLLSKTEYHILETAASKISSHDLLADIALHVKHKNADLEDMHVIVMKKITDQKLLVDLAVRSPSVYARREAINNLEDQELLIAFATNDKNDGVLRQQAIRKIKDTAVLLQLAKTCRDATLSFVAMDKLKDQALLADVAANAESSCTRGKAASKLTSRSALEKLLEREKDPHARVKICLKLGGHAIKGCQCARCGEETHDYEFLSSTEEQISRIAAVTTLCYQCKNCGKKKEERVGGGID